MKMFRNWLFRLTDLEMSEACMVSTGSSSHRFAEPSYRGGPDAGQGLLLSLFCRLALCVPCEIDELTRPLRGHPFSTRKGGARYHALLFPRMWLEGVVQEDSLIPLSPLSRCSRGRACRRAGWLLSQWESLGAI